MIPSISENSILDPAGVKPRAIGLMLDKLTVPTLLHLTHLVKHFRLPGLPRYGSAFKAVQFVSSRPAFRHFVNLSGCPLLEVLLPAIVLDLSLESQQADCLMVRLVSCGKSACTLQLSAGTVMPQQHSAG